MHARLISIDAAGLDLEALRPEGESFQYALTLEVAVDGADGSEIYYLSVCSPAWLAKEEAALWGAGVLVIKTWKPQRIREVIAQKINSVEGATVDSVLDAVGKFAQSEFDNYQPFRPDDK